MSNTVEDWCMSGRMPFKFFKDAARLRAEQTPCLRREKIPEDPPGTMSCPNCHSMQTERSTKIVSRERWVCPSNLPSDSIVVPLYPDDSSSCIARPPLDQKFTPVDIISAICEDPELVGRPARSLDFIRFFEWNCFQDIKREGHHHHQYEISKGRVEW